MGARSAECGQRARHSTSHWKVPPIYNHRGTQLVGVVLPWNLGVMGLSLRIVLIVRSIR